MAKAGAKKAFTRKDYAATELDFENALKEAMASSVALAQSESLPVSPQRKGNRRPRESPTKKHEKVLQLCASLPTPVRSRRSRSRSLRLSLHERSSLTREDEYNLEAAAGQKEALESWVLDRVHLRNDEYNLPAAIKPDAAERHLASLVAEVMLQKAEASSKLMSSHLALALQQSALSSCARAPPHRCLANLLLASCLRNDSPLEDMNAGKVPSQGTLGDARFTELELLELLRYASVNLSVIMLSQSKLRSMSLADMPGLDTQSMHAFIDAQAGQSHTSTGASSEDDVHWTASELACWVRCAAVHALGSADGWDMDSHSGGLCGGGPPVPSRIAASPNFALMQPRLKVESDAEDDDIRGCFRSWQMMRLIFCNTRFLCVERPRALPRNCSRLSEEEMQAMITQACGNMEVVLERWQFIGTSAFDKWLNDALEVQANSFTTRRT